MAGRFPIITDEHWSLAHVAAGRAAGWDVARVEDVLSKGTKDPVIIAYCAQHGLVWITNDKRSQTDIAAWLGSGKTLPGVVIAVQKRKRITPGRFVRYLEMLAAEEAPFAGTIRFMTPEEG